MGWGLDRMKEECDLNASSHYFLPVDTITQLPHALAAMRDCTLNL